jgi:hypothetical protein
MKFVTESHGPRIEKLPAGTIQMWIGYRSPKLMEVTMSTGLPIDEHDGLLPTFKVLLEDLLTSRCYFFKSPSDSEECFPWQLT